MIKHDYRTTEILGILEKQCTVDRGMNPTFMGCLRDIRN